MSKLVITEKPSVAQSIAKVLSATKRRSGYLEGNGYLVSWCIGHLVELAPPDYYDERYKKWKKGDLPILPANWKYTVSHGTKKQFNILKELMNRDDVDSLIANVKHFFTLLGKMFFTSYGKEFFTYLGKQIFTS